MNWHDLSTLYLQWPWMLLLLLLVPLFWWLYLKRLRQRLVRQALNFSYAAVVEQIKTAPPVWKRLLFPGTVSVIMTLMMVALSRPTIVTQVPVNSADIMLVLDISLSMMANDIQPDRLTAARQAAIDFVESLPSDARVGLEFFAGSTYVVTPPIPQHAEVVNYLKALNLKDLKPRTEIGSALQAALQVLSPPDTSGQTPPKTAERPDKKTPDRVIVLLSDGDSHEGFPSELAARQARAANITVYTIGVGSPEGGTITYQGLQLPVNFDETTLRETARLGGGQYFRVFKQDDFRTVYDQIQKRTIHYEQRAVDLAFILAGAGLATLLIALGVAMVCL
ncbi:VWA domain-containing protein [Vampirovibrio chlorellavorus]|uniref:VWA domain-containing protein n=1 Tax=Vampirovibrio chlorellavorus TaxID=758823 RepID=UPI0026EB8BE9|nr:VWA domain-containing protein [Vampirovibrio chlorellavorus]